MKIFNEYFSNIVPNLDIQRLPSIALHHDPVLNAITKFENHPSILEIKKQISSDVAFLFSFRKVNLTEIINEIKNLDEPKATQSNDIPTKVIKENYDIFATYITENFNSMIKNSVFPDSRNKKILSQYRKKIRNEKQNYRPASILPNLSKIYGRCMYTQMNKYFDHILSKYQFRFRKGYSSQQCLLIMI